MMAALVVTTASFVLVGGGVMLSHVIWTAAILLTHYAAFLYIFYKAGLQTAQYVPATLLLAGAVALKTGIAMNVELPSGGVEYVALFGATVLFLLSAKCSTIE